MRHRNAKGKLNRDKGARNALLHNLSESMILNGYITTTIAKAKFVKPALEKLVTKAKSPTLANRRILTKSLRKKTLVTSLIDNVAPVFLSREGGYTRIQRVGFRNGDNAELVKLSFVDPILKPKVLDKDTKKTAKSSEKKAKSESKQSKDETQNDAEVTEAEIIKDKKTSSKNVSKKSSESLDKKESVIKPKK